MLIQNLLTTTAIAALLVCTACGQKTTPPAQTESQETQTNALANKPAPDAADRTTAAIGNEIEQVASPTTTFTSGEVANGLMLNDVPNPATTLSTAAVKTANGEALGEVRSVIVGPNGKVTAIIVDVGGFLNVGERGVSIDAAAFTYLKDRNILVANVDKAAVEKMPPIVPAVK